MNNQAQSELEYADGVISRLKAYFHVEKDADLARKLRLPPSTVGSWRARGSVPYEECVEVARAEAGLLEFLLLGRAKNTGADGRYRLAEPHLSSEDVAQGLEQIRPKDFLIRVEINGRDFDVNPDDYRFVPLYDIEFGAGNGRVINFDVPPIAFDAYRKDFLREQQILDAALFKAKLIGDSMYPHLLGGSTQLFNASDKAIRSGEIYGLRIGEELICKYLRYLPGGQVEVRSHNPAPQYSTFTVNADQIGLGEIEIVGRLIPS